MPYNGIICIYHNGVIFHPSSIWNLVHVYTDIILLHFCGNAVYTLSWKLKWAFLFDCRLFVCPSVCKLSTFSSSSPKLLSQFQPNLAQSILVWREFNFIKKKSLCYALTSSNSSQELLDQSQPNLVCCMCRVRRRGGYFWVKSDVLMYFKIFFSTPRHWSDKLRL